MFAIGTCLVQTEQRDQIIKQHCQSEEATQPSDDDSAALIGGLDNLLANFSANNDQDHQQDDLAALIESFGNSGLSNKPLTPMVHGHWTQEHNVRRLSPLGSEQKQQQQQQQYHQYQSQTQPLPPINFIPGVDHYCLDNYQFTTDKVYSSHDGIPVSSSQQQPPVVMTSHNTYPVVATPYNISSLALAASLNSSTTSLTSPLSSSSSMPYSYYNYLPKDTSSVNPILPLSSFNNIVTDTGGASSAPTTAMKNTLCLGNENGGIQNIIPSNSQRINVNADGSNGGFSNATAALQRPLPAQYNINTTRSIDNIGSSVSYGAANDFSQTLSTTMLSQHQQFYPHQYQQQIPGSVIGHGTTGILLQQHQLIAGNGSTGVSADVQSSLSLTSPSIATTSVNSCRASLIHQSPSITSVSGTSTASNFMQQLYQQQQQHPQLYQQQQPQLYLQQQHQQQHPQLYQQEPQVYQQSQQQQQPQIYQQPQQTQQLSQIYQQTQQQPSQIYQQPQQTQQPSQIYQQLQQQPHQLTTPGGNTTSVLYYSSQQQKTSQLYQPQHQLQPAAMLTSTVTLNQQQPSPLLNNSGNSYYQQLQQQYHPPTTIAAVTPPLNTNTTPLNNYYYQQPSMGVSTFNQNQHQQQYYQQQHPSVGGGITTAATSITTPIVNLLDDDQQISGPPPIQPEKISGLVSDCTIKALPSSTINNK